MGGFTLRSSLVNAYEVALLIKNAATISLECDADKYDIFD